MKKLKTYLNRQTASYTIALCAAVALFMALSNLSVVAAVWDKIIDVFSPFIYAFAVAFVLNRPMMWCERKMFSSSASKRGLSILNVYVITSVILTVLFSAVIPQLGLSISYIIDNAPGFFVKAYDITMMLLNEFHWSRQLIEEIQKLWSVAMETVTQFSISALPGVFNFSLSLGGSAIDLIMVLIISVYMLAGKERLLFQFRKATYAFFSKETADKLVDVAHRANFMFSEFIIGKLIDSTIIGILAFIGMLFIYPQYSVLIAVIVGVTNMIPFFGPFIGAIPCVFILLVVSPMSAVVFAVFVFALQQFDGNILGPKILGDSLGLSPIWVLVGILVGNGLFGLVGMLIGVPSFALLYNLVSENINSKLQNKGISTDYDSNSIDFNKAGEEDDANKEKN
ncbi:MAG: AI-2E family transporter [Oscillospiraceae bacterium]|nr:AI-2E family transporter [Oscillospiraceae bacterium]